MDQGGRSRKMSLLRRSRHPDLETPVHSQEENSSMPREQNEALVRRHEELISQHDLEAAFAELSPNFLDHAVPPGMPGGIEAAKQFFTMVIHAFPDLHMTVEDRVAEGDRVVTRLIVRGTHKGTFMGVAPTEKHAQWGIINIYRVMDGKIIEHWSETDEMALMQQLGVVPPPR
jgi:predicted ester cyclase